MPDFNNSFSRGFLSRECMSESLDSIIACETMSRHVNLIFNVTHSDYYLIHITQGSLLYLLRSNLSISRAISPRLKELRRTPLTRGYLPCLCNSHWCISTSSCPFSVRFLQIKPDGQTRAAIMQCRGSQVLSQYIVTQACRKGRMPFSFVVLQDFLLFRRLDWYQKLLPCMWNENEIQQLSWSKRWTEGKRVGGRRRFISSCLYPL